jgi:hypothetical protein
LSFFGSAALVLANASATFINVTFSANNNSAGTSCVNHASRLLAPCMPGITSGNVHQLVGLTGNNHCR